MVRELSEFGRTVGSQVLRRVGRATARYHEETPLPVDVLESDDEFLVVFDAPGATASDIQVAYLDGAIEVRIDRFREYREGYDVVFPGRGMSLDGRAELPADATVDDEAAYAKLGEDGTLSVFVPKTAPAPDAPVEQDA
jgi:HSP20 family molecular chaperone IbpA